MLMLAECDKSSVSSGCVWIVVRKSMHAREVGSPNSNEDYRKRNFFIYSQLLSGFIKVSHDAICND
jgi:hypothetical protein